MKIAKQEQKRLSERVIEMESSENESESESEGESVPDGKVAVKTTSPSRRKLESEEIEIKKSPSSRKKQKLTTLKHTNLDPAIPLVQSEPCDESESEKESSDEEIDRRDMPKSMNQPEFKRFSTFKNDGTRDIVEWLEEFESHCAFVKKRSLKLYHLQTQLDFDTVRRLFLRAKNKKEFRTYAQAKQYLINKYQAKDSNARAFEELQKVRQSKSQTVDEFVDKLEMHYERCASFGHVLRDFEKKYYLTEHCQPYLRIEMKKDISFHSWDLDNTITHMNAFEAANKTAVKEQLNIMTDNLDSNKRISQLEKKNKQLEQKLNSFSSSGKNTQKEKKKPFVKKPGSFYSSNMKQFYSDSVWEERNKAWRGKKNPKTVPHCYNKDSFNGTPACILCHKTGHTPDCCHRLKDMTFA